MCPPRICLVRTPAWVPCVTRVSHVSLSVQSLVHSKTPTLRLRSVRATDTRPPARISLATTRAANLTSLSVGASHAVSRGAYEVTRAGEARLGDAIGAERQRQTLMRRVHAWLGFCYTDGAYVFCRAFSEHKVNSRMAASVPPPISEGDITALLQPRQGYLWKLGGGQNTGSKYAQPHTLTPSEIPGQTDAPTHASPGGIGGGLSSATMC